MHLAAHHDYYLHTCHMVVSNYCPVYTILRVFHIFGGGSSSGSGVVDSDVKVSSQLPFVCHIL